MLMLSLEYSLHSTLDSVAVCLIIIIVIIIIYLTETLKQNIVHTHAQINYYEYE